MAWGSFPLIDAGIGVVVGWVSGGFAG